MQWSHDWHVIHTRFFLCHVVYIILHQTPVLCFEIYMCAVFLHSKFWNRLKPGDEQKDKYTVQPGLSAEELYHQSMLGGEEHKQFLAGSWPTPGVLHVY